MIFFNIVFSFPLIWTETFWIDISLQIENVHILIINIRCHHLWTTLLINIIFFTWQINAQLLGLLPPILFYWFKFFIAMITVQLLLLWPFQFSHWSSVNQNLTLFIFGSNSLTERCCILLLWSRWLKSACRLTCSSLYSIHFQFSKNVNFVTFQSTVARSDRW